jgi:hypothetical protein
LATVERPLRLRFCLNVTPGQLTAAEKESKLKGSAQ